MDSIQKLNKKLEHIVYHRGLNDLIPKYLISLSKDVKIMREALSCKDVEQLRLTLHKLKGSALSFGFLVVDELVEALRARVHQNEWTDFSDILTLFEKYILNCQDHLAKEQERKAIESNSMLDILVTDDDESIRIILKKYLSTLDCRILEASSVSEAIEMTKKFRPVLVLMDINFINHSGFTYLEAIKRDPEYSKIKVIMISSYPDHKYVHQAFAMGASDFIIKPFEMNTVLNKVKKTLEKIRSSMQNKGLYSLNFPVKLLIKCHPLILRENSILIDSPVRFGKDEKVIVIDKKIIHEKAVFQRIGVMYSSQKGRYKAVLSFVGDYANSSEHSRPTLESYDEEELLIQKNIKTYILDDDTSFLELIKSFLNRMGGDVTTFTNKEDFASGLKACCPDLIIMDLSLKGLNDTFETIEKTREQYPSVSILVVTSNTDGKSVSHAIELGANDYLFKPIRRNALIHKVLRCLSTHEIVKSLMSSSKGSNISEADLILDAKIVKVDELGIYLVSSSLITKGSLVSIQFDQHLIEKMGKSDFQILIRKNSVITDEEKCLMYGEFINLDIEEIELLKNYLITF